MAISAISAALSYVIKEINDYINRLDIAKDKLSETTSELESVESEIDSISSKIKDLESSGPLSLTDKEELERLKEENAELEKRQQYLEKQKKAESEKVIQYAKEKMDYNYGRETSREDIDAYKKYMDNPEAYSGTYYEDDALTIKIAQYEKYKELRKQAIENDDWESVEILDKNLQQIEESLIADRTELQGFRDDLSLTGESSEELDNVNNKLKFIDDLLLSPGQNLKNFINTDISEEDKQNLSKLAEEGNLTADVLKEQFSSVDKYLKDNGLTLEDLISLLVKYKNELSTIPVVEPPSFTKQMQGIHGLSEGLDQLDSIMADIIDGETFDYSSILNNEDFKNAFGNYKEEYENFIETITNSPNDISKCQDAFDQLATAYVHGSEALSDLSEETRNAAILDLKQMGIENAEEIVDAYLNIADIKEEIVNQGYDFANITYEECLQLMQLGEVSLKTKEYLFYYQLQKALSNDNPLSTVEDCNQLLILAENAGVTGSVIANLNELMRLHSEISLAAQYQDKDTVAVLTAKAEGLLNSIKEQTAEIKTGYEPVARYGGGVGSLAAKQEKAADATDKLTDALEKEKEALEETKSEMEELHDAVIWFYDKQIDAIDDKIEAINEENEALEKQLENMDRVLDAIEDNYDAEIEKIQEKIDALQDENDEEERALKLEQAKQKLAEAKSRKTQLV